MHKNCWEGAERCPFLQIALLLSPLAHTEGPKRFAKQMDADHGNGVNLLMFFHSFIKENMYKIRSNGKPQWGQA